MADLKLSVIVPVYNERYLVAELLRRVLRARPQGVASTELIVVDDGSTDGSREILRALAAEHPEAMRLIEHERNAGKGAALRTGIQAATGDLILFQDADLEYDPDDYDHLVRPFLEDGADVVYGSRFLPSERRRVLGYRHTLGNRLLTAVSNWFTNLDLTDMETCYKMFRAPLLKSIPIRSRSFAIEPEITAKVAKREARVFEVPISYLGRTDLEGKKIGPRDLFLALGAILRFWLRDDLYHEDEVGSQNLYRLDRVRRLNRWIAEEVRPRVGDRVLEIGAGIGNVSVWLTPRDHYLVSETNPHFLHYLRNLALGKPYLEVREVDVESDAGFAELAGRFDTVLCLSVLEDVKEPVAALRRMRSALEPGGRLVLYVPAHPELYCALDEALGHRCRYTREALEQELSRAGLELSELREFNRLGALGWRWTGVHRGRRSFGQVPLKLFDLMVPLLRRVDARLPGRGLGWIAVARRPAAPS